MRTALFSIMALVFVFGAAAPAPAQEEAQAILQKAIKVHGGAARLAKLRDGGVQTKCKGKLSSLGGIDFTLETSVQMPDKIKTVFNFEVNGMNVSTIQVFNGDNFWLNVNGQDLSKLFDDKARAEVKEQIYQERLVGLAFSKKDKDIELSPLGEIKVEGKDAVGVRISSKGHRDVNLYFDKASGLMAKIEARVLDIQSGQEKSQEKILLNYKEVDGVQRPGRVIINQDDKQFMDLEILEVTYSDKLADSEFAKP